MARTHSRADSKSGSTLYKALSCIKTACLTLYHTTDIFERKAFGKSCAKCRKCSLIPMKDKFNVLSNIEFVVCKWFQLGQSQNCGKG